MNHLDYKFVMLLSNRLEGFTVKNSNPLKINCRCFVCGDSKKSKSKKRGWFTETKTGIYYNCFNCGTGMWLDKVIETIDTNLHKEFLLEKKLEWMNETKPEEVKRPVIETPKYNTRLFDSLKTVSQLPIDHPVKKYVMKRKIPSETHFRLFYSPKFNKFVNSIIPNKLDESNDEPRLVIPFFDNKGILFGFTGRNFSKDGIRYITIMLDKTKVKGFGLNTVNMKEKFYVTEGPIDSLFLPNSISSCDSSLYKVVPDEFKDNAVLIFDCEPRNNEIIKQIQKSINLGYTVCIWDKSMCKHGKDINEMVLSGLTKEQIKSIIDNNTVKDLMAKLKLAEFKLV